MYKSYSMELAGRTLTVDINRVAKQANGAALMHYGDTRVLSTATASRVIPSILSGNSCPLAVWGCHIVMNMPLS